ncbi:hypothetical protein PRZ48_009526 [Zasmidium cellare]|uniref:Metallo-beta-lactamase domain-containing protein n=1 Tax=Zasmidium cellare TaxID=395010 RepID=A0ABR0EBZ0_ZASCE|nr:hypothetical protein PRZ48_009526 [Zasmidium cellare]
MAPNPQPNLNIPSGSTPVTVSAIDTTLWLSGIPTESMYDPPIPGFGRVRCGCWSLLITHPSGRNLLYDLGMRKDWWNCAPAVGIKEYLENGTLESLDVKKNVAEILEEGGVGLGSVEAVVWSHFHFDHTGDMSSFPPSTKLIMGEGGKEAFMPGWPVDPEAQTLESDFEGREVVEVDFKNSNLKIGGFRAVDYFGDGSFYLLDSPGHAIGHVNALARTGIDPPEYVHMCGDSAHHCGEIRPSKYLPLPDDISPSPLPLTHATPCPGGLFSKVLRNGSKENHILELIDPGAGTYKQQKYALIYDDEKLKETVREVEGFDACEEVFTVLAHDWTLKGVIEEWPRSLNGWSKKGWKTESRWKFLKDFGEAVVHGA